MPEIALDIPSNLWYTYHEMGSYETWGGYSPIRRGSVFICYRHYRIHPNGQLVHYRRGKDKDGNKLTPWMPKEKGGRTDCFIFGDKGSGVEELLALGVAECSMKDQFCYALGREIARGRAMKQLTCG